MYSGAEISGILVRLVAVALLVAGAYNPSGDSYYHWVINGGTESLASKIFVGVVIAVALAICFNAMWRALRLLLLLPGLILIASLIWLLAAWHWIDLADPLQRTLVIESVVVLVLTTGLIISPIRYRLAAQMDTRTVR